MSEKPVQGGPEGLEPFDHEIHSGSILRIMAVLALVTVATFAVSWGVYRILSNSEVAADPQPSPLIEAREPVVPQGPRLQARPEQELARMRAEDAVRLNGWGWVSRGSGVAHVPVDRAIDAVAAAGQLPDFAGPAEPVAGDPVQP
jgi:hypothetical protein